MFGKKKVDLSSYLDDEPIAKIEKKEEEKIFTRKLDTSALQKNQVKEENVELEEKSSSFNDEKKEEIKSEDINEINYNYETVISESKEIEEKEEEEEIKTEEQEINYNYETIISESKEIEEKEEEEEKNKEKNKKYLNLLNWDVRKTVNKEVEKKEDTEEEKQKIYEEITSKVEINDEKLKKIENDVELFGNYKSDYKEKEVEKTNISDENIVKIKKIMTPKQKITLIISIIAILLTTTIGGLFFTEKNGITNFGLFIKNNNINEEKEEEEYLNEISEWKMNSKNVNGYDITFEERDNYLNKEYRFNDKIFSSIEELDISINKYLEELIGSNEELSKEEIEEMIREKIIRIYLQRIINR